jgi:type 1 glutamine amidotransferase
MKWTITLLAASTLFAFCATAAPKKILVVTVTQGFRHSSIPTAEKVIGELAADSKAFRVDYARVEPTDPQFKGPDGKPDKAKVDEAIKKVLAEKMSPKALRKLDGVIFANTTGELPLPDREAFLNWIKSGKSFVGMHAASDTFKEYPAYVDMIGGRFKSHGPQVSVDVLNKDSECPMCRHWGDSMKIFEEIYLLQDFDPAKVHTVLALDKHPNEGTPGNFPLSWVRYYGKGKVFYTALGHREDIWDDDTPPSFERKNPKEVSLAYQAHILKGIKWTLGMEQWELKD